MTKGVLAACTGDDVLKVDKVVLLRWGDAAVPPDVCWSSSVEKLQGPGPAKYALVVRPCALQLLHKGGELASVGPALGGF